MISLLFEERPQSMVKFVKKKKSRLLIGSGASHISILIASEARLLGFVRGPSSHLQTTKCRDSLIKGTVKKIE